MLDKRININSHQKKKYPLPTSSSVPKPDIFISVSNSIFPLHRARMMDSEVIGKFQTSKQIALINQNLDIKIVECVLSFYYGNNIQIITISDLYKILEVIRILKIKNLQKLIIMKITQDLKQHNVFIILQFAYQFGLQNLGVACLQYLKQQEFQQVKYHQYNLYQCQFTLFQVVIRRHHTLKMNNKINGLTLDILEWIINNYCKRNQLDLQIKQKLYQKYIHCWKNHSSIKDSLKIQKIQQIKNIGQSSTIYGNDSEKISKESNKKTSQKIFSPIRARRFSVEIEKQLQLVGLNQNSQPEIFTNMISSIELLSPYSNQSYINMSGQITKFKMNKNTQENQKVSMKIAKSQQDEIIEQIQSLSLANNNTRNSKAKSMIFHEVIEEQIEESTDFKNKKHLRRHSKSIQQSQFGIFQLFK